MEQGKFEMFQNRLEKVYRHRSKQARRQGIDCFRIYDHDLPEFPFIVERFDDKLYVSEYKRHHDMEDTAYEFWLERSKEIMAVVTGIAFENIFARMRQRKSGRKGQYQKLDEEKNEFVVKENGLSFFVNLTDYLDTGLFLDHRITRQMVREASNQKSVLNLFAYTGSFSVYAAAGNASSVVTVDLSKTYLDWAKRNMELNFSSFPNHHIVHADVKQFLKEEKKSRYDIIVLDPPTFSNSKRMEDILDIQRDHVELVNDCLELLHPGGVIYFSNNFTKFELHTSEIRSKEIKDITKATTPFDFEGKLNRPCYKIRKM
ncbi:MAG: class I SAM-dependent methyltransferase [Flavisolibacter sp.]|jgi:23S rRNA (cytosine1962-C5)-methyltransferase|nr:class I SAM-dependent methyltransferase [Flavisolibacter sp.]